MFLGLSIFKPFKRLKAFDSGDNPNEVNVASSSLPKGVVFCSAKAIILLGTLTSELIAFCCASLSLFATATSKAFCA